MFSFNTGKWSFYIDKHQMCSSWHNSNRIEKNICLSPLTTIQRLSEVRWCDFSMMAYCTFLFAFFNIYIVVNCWVVGRNVLACLPRVSFGAIQTMKSYISNCRLPHKVPHTNIFKTKFTSECHHFILAMPADMLTLRPSSEHGGKWNSCNVCAGVGRWLKVHVVISVLLHHM